MEKVEKYRDCIKQVLTKYAAYKPSYVGAVGAGSLLSFKGCRQVK